MRINPPLPSRTHDPNPHPALRATLSRGESGEAKRKENKLSEQGGF
jgi:hypothetical protein